MEDPGQTAVNTLSHRPDRISGPRDRESLMCTPHGNCYAPGLEHRSPGPIDVIAALAERFSFPAPKPRYPESEPHTADRARESGELHNLYLREKMGKAK
jgi:hypothetical protein